MIPLRDTIRSRSFPLVNWLIILVNVLVFVFIELALPPRRLDQFLVAYGMVPARLMALQPRAVLTIFTSMFLHGGWLHLISNMWALYIFGDNVEDRMGSGRYVLFYLICGTAASLVQAAVNLTSKMPMIGASGAIAGVLAAYLILYPRSRVLTLIPIFIVPWFVEIPAVLYLIFWFVLQFFNGLLALGEAATLAGGVAYWAHIGGFLVGLVLLPFFARRHQSPFTPEISP